MLEEATTAISGSEQLWQRMAMAPMRTTSGSSRKRLTMGSAKIKVQVEIISRAVTPTFMQNRYPSRTRSNFLAPQLKPQTGWNPWPKPKRAEKVKNMTRLTTEKAAMAASASLRGTAAAAAALRHRVATLPRPWRRREGRPPATMFLR